MLSSRRIAQTPAVQKAIGLLAAEYLRLVWWTNRLVLEPADFYERVAPELPVIVTSVSVAKACDTPEDEDA